MNARRNPFDPFWTRIAADEDQRISMAHPFFVDRGGNDTYDLYVAHLGTDVRVLRNRGTPAVPQFDYPNNTRGVVRKTIDDIMLEIESGCLSGTVGDIDDDGDLDILIGDWFGQVHIVEHVKEQACHI
jgi:hypothetical protein